MVAPLSSHMKLNEDCNLPLLCKNWHPHVESMCVEKYRKECSFRLNLSKQLDKTHMLIFSMPTGCTCSGRQVFTNSNIWEWPSLTNFPCWAAPFFWFYRGVWPKGELPVTSKVLLILLIKLTSKVDLKETSITESRMWHGKPSRVIIRRQGVP